MTTTTNHIKACTQAWLHCEDLLLSLIQRPAPLSTRTQQVLDECALICLGTVEALRKQCKNISELALLCVGICEECADVCERYKEKTFQSCAATCRECAALFTPLAAQAINK